MLLSPRFGHNLIGVTLVVTISGMLGALVWAVPRLRTRTPFLPPGRPRIGPWGAITVLAAFLTYYFVLGQVVGSVVIAAADPGFRAQLQANAAPDGGRPGVAALPGDPTAPAARKPSFTAQMLAATIVNAMSLLALPGVVLLLSRASLSDLGLTVDRLGASVKAGGVAFLLVTPCVYLVFLYSKMVIKGTEHPLEKMILAEWSPLGIVLAVASAVVFAPLAEELFFRAILLGWLNRVVHDSRARSCMIAPDSDCPVAIEGAGDTAAERSSPLDLPDSVAAVWFPIVASSLFFAAMHAAVMPTPFALFVLALALGYLYQRTGSLIAPIVLHALFNGFSTLLLLHAVT
jgi:membrane protease YdiL (CAAX protease family)